jgi:hypothetical protein
MPYLWEEKAIMRLCLVSDFNENWDEVVEWPCRTQKRRDFELLCASWPGVQSPTIFGLRGMLELMGEFLSQMRVCFKSSNGRIELV